MERSERREKTGTAGRDWYSVANIGVRDTVMTGHDSGAVSNGEWRRRSDFVTSRTDNVCDGTIIMRKASSGKAKGSVVNIT